MSIDARTPARVKQLSPMSLMRDNALGVYISIPFCRSKCTYCNFASGVYPASEHQRYVERLIEDMVAAEKWAAQSGAELPRPVDTVYLGGGTPTLLAPELITRLFAALRTAFDVRQDAEITVECAPGQLTDGTLEALANAGVNRMSLGVQSFIDREAHESGRLHSRDIVFQDLHRLRQAGIGNLNVDLIAGLAGQTFASWDESLAALTESAVPHASVYMLEVDEDSRLGREMLGGGVRYHAGLVPSDDAIARMYETAIDRLCETGLEQYEISNFAKPGHASRHNLRYWQCRPYLGLGLDASSMLRAAVPGSGFIVRSTATDDLKAYLAGSRPTTMERMSFEQQHEEAWFLGLRLNSGVQIEALRREFGDMLVVAALEVVAKLVDDGLLIAEGETVRLSPRGRMLSNDVFQEFLGLATDRALVGSAE